MNRIQLNRAQQLLLVAVTFLFCYLTSATTLPAATVVTGDVTPPLPWGTSTDARIGSTSSGTLSVDAGSRLSSNSAQLGYSSGSMGAATITGPGSKWTTSTNYFFNVGYLGSGVLRVEDGGEVSGGVASVGDSLGSTGEATITGAGSKWTSGTLYVGKSGSGTLTVEDGGQISSKYSTLGESSGSMGIVTISGADSSWSNTSSVDVGIYGSGTLRVEDGGEVSSGSAHLGSSSGSTGQATITGAGSKWTSGRLQAGGGSGTLLVEAGGQVVSTWCWLGSKGAVTITGAGSQWTIVGDATYDSRLLVDVHDNGR